MKNHSGYFKVDSIKNINPKDILSDMLIDESEIIIDDATEFLKNNKNSIKITESFIHGKDLILLNNLCNANYKQIKINYTEKQNAEKLIFEYKEKIKNKAEDLFNIKLEHDDIANELNLKSKYLNGRMPYFATDIHTDLLTDKEKNMKYHWSGHISNLLYLNDDYLGGELYFPYHDIKIKPKAGMLISFPGNWYNRHGIMPADNFRYAINIFLKITNFPNFIIKNKK